MNKITNSQPSTAIALLATIVLSACGGGSGDTAPANNNNNSGAEALAPLIGTWQLPGDWRGLENDEAVLRINEPGSDGMAATTIYDYDDASTGLGRNCYDVDGTGSVVQSLSNELFMDISAFPDAIVSINAADNLVISYSIGAATSTDRETKTITATRLGLEEVDIAPRCESA